MFQIQKGTGKCTWINVANRFPLKAINKLTSYNFVKGLCYSSVILTNAAMWEKVLTLNCDKDINVVPAIIVYDNTKNGEVEPR